MSKTILKKVLISLSIESHNDVNKNAYLPVK